MTIEHAIANAIAYAEQKRKVNKLFGAGDESPASKDFENGDPETIYSIAALYAQDVDDENYIVAEDMLESALAEAFPDYVD